MKVKWNVHTGYVTREPARTIDIDDEDLEGMTDDEKEKYIDECIQEAFAQNISWYRVDK